MQAEQVARGFVRHLKDFSKRELTTQNVNDLAVMLRVRFEDLATPEQKKRAVLAALEARQTRPQETVMEILTTPERGLSAEAGMYDITGQTPTPAQARALEKVAVPTSVATRSLLRRLLAATSGYFDVFKMFYLFMRTLRLALDVYCTNITGILIQNLPLSVYAAGLYERMAPYLRSVGDRVMELRPVTQALAYLRWFFENMWNFFCTRYLAEERPACEEMQRVWLEALDAGKLATMGLDMFLFLYTFSTGCV